MIIEYMERFTISYRYVILLVLIMVMMGSPSFAVDECTVNLRWSPNPETYVTGYKIYYGTSQGGPYLFIVDVGNPALIDGFIHGSVAGLAAGGTYYFVATAYDADGLESAPCAEVRYTCSGSSPPPVDTTPPSPPSGLNVH